MIPPNTNTNTNTNAKSNDPSSKPLLSRSSILLLSGMLIGIVATEIVPQGLRFSASMAGAIGLIAYFAMQTASNRYQKHTVDLKRRIVSLRLERLINMHSPHGAGSLNHRRPRSVRPRMDRQYVTVTMSENNRHRPHH